MEKNIKVDEDLWKKLQQEKLDKSYKKVSDLIRIKINFAERFEKMFLRLKEKKMIKDYDDLADYIFNKLKKKDEI